MGSTQSNHIHMGWVRVLLYNLFFLRIKLSGASKCTTLNLRALQKNGVILAFAKPLG